MRVLFFLCFASVTILGSGCRTVSQEACGPKEKSPKTLLSWEAGPKDDKQDEGDKDEGEKNGSDKKDNNGEKAKGEKGNGGGPAERAKEPNKPDSIVTDRPDFTEASSTVGKGRIQLEAGYTFIGDRSGGVATNHSSYPEALLRIGAFADWFEFRLGQNFGHDQVRPLLGGAFSASGGEDLYLGVKLGLTEQKKILPELALIIQTTVPTGHSAFTSHTMQPGLNLLYGWDVIEDRLSFGGSSQANRAIDDFSHGYVELAQSLTVNYGLTEKLGAYTEWFAFFPTGATSPGIGPQHYFDGGFTYQVTPNFQLDIRAGVGLNRRADDYFVGSGFAVRY